jgi:hypothetical protein
MRALHSGLVSGQLFSGGFLGAYLFVASFFGACLRITDFFAVRAHLAKSGFFRGLFLSMRQEMFDNLSHSLMVGRLLISLHLYFYIQRPIFGVDDDFVSFARSKSLAFYIFGMLISLHSPANQLIHDVLFGLLRHFLPEGMELAEMLYSLFDFLRVYLLSQDFLQEIG